MNDTLIASRRHTAIVLAIVAAITALGIQQASSLSAMRPGRSRVLPYLTLIAMQLLWVGYVRSGLDAHHHSLSELTGRRPSTARSILVDVLYAAICFAAARSVAATITSSLGGPPANTAFLLPHGVLESMLWVLLSITAGICEEIVFRGYLQRQFTALTGSDAAGILIQAVVFGASHGYQGRASMAVTGSYGLVLALLAWWRGNVRAAALAHAATDIVGGLAWFQPS